MKQRGALVFSITTCAKLLLFFAVFILSGCASIALSTWKDEFEESHQRTIEFAPSSIPADYLGKIEGAYVYEIHDFKNQIVTFRLPAKKDKAVEIYLDSQKNHALTGKSTMFHFNDHEQITDRESDFPQDVHVFTSSIMTSFRYSCKDGKFDNDVNKSIKPGIKCDRDGKNCHGLSSFDSFTLGIRNAGYVIAIPLDVASLPITLPLGLILVATYCGPFGCP